MMLTSTQIGELAAQFFIAGVGTLCFAVLFACPRKSLFFCGLVGAVGWFGAGAAPPPTSAAHMASAILAGVDAL